jgi:hypothetical protein
MNEKHTVVTKHHYVTVGRDLMNTHLEIAKHRLFSKGALDAADIKLFPGSSRDASKEQMAEQIVKAIAQIEAGDFDEVDTSTDDC